MQVHPYLVFHGQCEEAINFYKAKLGAEVLMMMRFKDMPGGLQPGMVSPGGENKVMHAALQIGESKVMASDGKCGSTGPTFDGFSLSLDAADEAQAQRLFTALSDGGTVTMPLNKTFFAKQFGMVTDRFGISWMVIAQ